MQILQKITKEQNKEVYNLIEKRNALINLKRILNIQIDNELYLKCSQELEQVEKCYKEWWEYIIREYGLENCPREQLYVDGARGQIFLT